jgi:glycine dehydrogenase
MLESIGFDSLESLVKSTIPSNILSPRPLDLQPPMSESEALSTIRAMADKNRVMKSYIGMGYYDTIVPGVILRNVLFAATTPASP